MNRMRIPLWSWLLIAGGLAAASCAPSGGGGGGGGGVSLPGTWSGEFLDSAEGTLFVHSVTGTLTVQFVVDGENLTGEITIVNDICDNNAAFTGNITGAFDGDTVEFSYETPSTRSGVTTNAPVTFTAILNDPMEGDYDAIPCDPDPQDSWVGQFALNKE